MVEAEEATNRRAFLTDKLLFPTIAGAVGGGLVQLLAKLLEQNRSLSISILALEDAEIKYGPSFLSPFGPDEPLPTPVPSPSTRFTYVTIFRNDGDFSEENVAIALGFQGEPEPDGPLADPQIVFSTPLLREAVSSPLTRQSLRDYLLRLSRLNPGESVSIQVSWQQPMRIVAQARSDEVSAIVAQ